MINYLILIGLAFINNLAFAMVSRSRNRDNMYYHSVASIISNFVWFGTMGYMVNQTGFSWDYAIPYTLGTVIGSVTGAKVSMYIEKVFNITSDGEKKN